MLKKIGEEALGNGMTVEWAWCDNVESPRDWEDNLGHILTWSRGCDSPDENPWADPVDFVADMLCEHFTFAELHGAVSAGRIGSLRFEAGEDGEERLLAWYKSMITGRAGWDDVEDYGDYRDKETLARAVAECAEATESASGEDRPQDGLQNGALGRRLLHKQLRRPVGLGSRRVHLGRR